MDNFQSGSIKYRTTIIKKVAQLRDDGKSIEIRWLHKPDDNDEDESLDLGKGIERESILKFDFVQMA